MRSTPRLRSLLLTGALTLIPLAGGAIKLADGTDWQKSTDTERAAYLVGVSNMISVGNAYDEKKLPGEDRTFMRQAWRGLSETTVAEAIKRVDAWYAANPNRLDIPVLSVLWIDIVKPRIGK
jgi:hypothetical protein